METAAAATARVGVYTDLLRVLRLRLSVCPLPVGPPHLVPRHIPLLPLLSVDKRVLPADCKGFSGLMGENSTPAADGAAAAVALPSSSPTAAQQQQKPAVLVPSESAHPTSPLARKQHEQASRLFGCTYTPKYPEHRHCHLPDPLLQPHVACAVVLYNIRRLGAPVIHWASAVCPRGDRGDPAAEWALAAVLGGAAPPSATALAAASAAASAVAPATASAVASASAPAAASVAASAAGLAAAGSAAAAGTAAGAKSSCGVPAVSGGECTLCLPPYVLRGESCEHVLQWLQWPQQTRPLLFACGLNEKGALGLGEAAYFPVDPVLEERDNFVKAARGTDVWWVLAAAATLFAAAAAAAFLRIPRAAALFQCCCCCLPAPSSCTLWPSAGVVVGVVAAPVALLLLLLVSGAATLLLHGCSCRFLLLLRCCCCRFCCQPQQVVALPGTVSSVSAGLHYSAAVTSDGLLFAWGSLDGCVDDAEPSSSSSSNSNSSSSADSSGTLRRHPADHSRDYGLSESLRFSWLDFPVRSHAAAAVTAAAAAWQEQQQQQQQQRQKENRVFLPALLSQSSTAPSICRGPSYSAAAFAAVSCGPDFCAAVTTTGCLYTWGNNANGVLGLGDLLSRDRPAAVSPELFVSVATGKQQQQQQQRLLQVACGNSHVAALTAEGCLFVWGSNSHGQCGFCSERATILSPQQLLLLDLSRMPLSRLTLIHSLVAASSDNNNNSSSSSSSSRASKGWLGLGYAPTGGATATLLVADAAGFASLLDKEDPLKCLFVESLIKFSLIACGSLHTISLGTAGEQQHEGSLQCLYTWGSNTNNCLGLPAAAAAADTAHQADCCRRHYQRSSV